MTSTKSRLLRSFLNCFRSFTYRFAKAIVVQTKGAGDFFPARLHGKIKIITNSVSISNLDNPDYDLSKPCILAIGRLEQQKRFDLLIDAFSELSSNFPDWNLYIFGEGSLRDKLLKQINSLKLDSRISMSGLTNTPQALLRECEIFVLCSDYEGFPGALCEAMAVGTAVVATNCHFGPSEIIDDGENGLLISKSNLNELVHSLERLIVDSQLRSTLASNSKTIVDRFSRDVVLEKWRSLIQESTNK